MKLTRMRRDSIPVRETPYQMKTADMRSFRECCQRHWLIEASVQQISPRASIVGRSVLGGLHHEYRLERIAA